MKISWGQYVFFAIALIVFLMPNSTLGAITKYADEAGNIYYTDDNKPGVRLGIVDYSSGLPSDKVVESIRKEAELLERQWQEQQKQVSEGYSVHVDAEYLERIQDDFVLMNKSILPVRLDSITEVEEIRLMELNGFYYVVMMARIDTGMKTMGANSLELIRKVSIKNGCSDPATMNYMEHGLKIGAIYINRDGDHLGEIQYSIEDCK